MSVDRHVKLTNIHKIAFAAIKEHCSGEPYAMTNTKAHFYASRIAAGTMWLTLLDNTWFDTVDTETLELFDCEHCVLGQVVGDYRACVTTEESDEIMRTPLEGRYSVDEANRLIEEAEDSGHKISYQLAAALGFHLDSEPDSNRRSYEALTAGWAAVIKHLQAKYPAPTDTLVDA